MPTWLALLALVLAAPDPGGTLRTEHFELRFRGARADAERIARFADLVHRRIVGDLGASPPEPTVVVVTASRSEFDAALPTGRPLPGWVAGVAYPRQNLVVLGPAVPGARVIDREVLLAHEFAHVALGHATKFHVIPAWFAEGFADLQAARPYLGDWRSPVGAGGASPIGELHRHLGTDPQRAGRDYQQSYDLVRFLHAQRDGEALRELVRRVGAGRPFDRALAEVYGITPRELQARWRKDWNYRQVLLPILTSGLLLWLLAAVLLVLGYLRRRVQRRRALLALDEPSMTEAELEGEGDGDEPWRLAPGDSPPEAPERPVLSVSLLLLATGVAGIGTALAALIWPYTRLSVLAGPAVLLALLVVRWAGRGR
jgi:hypothetical protein